MKSKLISSSSQIWKSRVSWKIAANVFLTILIVQGMILYVGIKDFENKGLMDLRDIAEASVVAILKTNSRDMSAAEIAMNSLRSPLDREDVENVINKTNIRGISVYAPDLMSRAASNRFALIETYGAPVQTTLSTFDDMKKTYYSPNGNVYEVVFDTIKWGTFSKYAVVVSIDSSEIQEELANYYLDSVKIIAALSGFVSAVLMITLWQILLEPMLFMRKNLVEASENPENPDIDDSPFNPNDEIGGAIELAQSLIRQNARNITQIKSAAEDQIHQLAYYDTLTGLPNRTSFLQTMSEKMKPSVEGEVTRYAILAIDLDHFKDINDSMGHNVGDVILRGVGKRLRSSMPEEAVVSRFGEDEFAIMMPLGGDVTSAKEVAERVMGVVRSKPFEVFNEQFQVRASVGVSTFPDDGTEADQIMKNADIALNRAKEEGRDSLKEYSEDFDKAVQQRFQMLRDLRDALEHDQITLHYQPQLDLKTGEIIGAEALLRWWKPDNSKAGGSFISPGDFIPVAEQSGLIVPIGEKVLRDACAVAKAFNEKHKRSIRIAVNVSAVQFSQSDLVAFVDKTLQESGLDPKLLELEVTESVFMDDIHHTIQTLQELHALGVELAIDDFGTGYSSLSYLRQFPIDRLKIDQSFIRNALNNADDAAITRTIIGLGQSLNLSVIAEGVETKDHETFLVEHGCDEVQGFRYCKPLPADELEQFIAGYDGKLSSFDA